MPDYKITAPDGNTYQVTAPEGATQDQVLQYAQANYQHPAVQSGDGLTHPSDVGSGATQGDALYGQGSTAPRSDSETMFQKINDFGNDLGDSFVHNVVKPVIGLTQDTVHGIKDSPIGMGLALGNRLGGGQPGATDQMLDNASHNIDSAIQNNEAAYQKAVPTNTASVLGAVAGNILPYAVGGEVLQAPRAITTLGKVAQGVAGGAMVGAAQPVTTGPQTSTLASTVTDEKPGPSFEQQKLEQVAAGGATGGLIPAVGAAGRQIIGSVAPEVQALAQKAQQYGIDLTAPQVSKSIPLKIANKTTGQVPFSGATAFADKQQGQFNNAVAQTIGLPDGTTKITPDVFAQAKNVIGQGYDDLASRNNLTINPPLISRIQSILGEAHTDGDPDAARAISNLTTEIIGKASQNGSTLTGPQFQSIDSRLGRLATGQGDKAHYAGELQDALRQGMESGMSPADAARSQELRSQWRNALNLTPILADGSGDIPPSRLLSAVANNKAGKTQLATGTRGDLGTLAQIGKQFLRDPAPDSGTAVRNVAFDTLKGLGAITAGATTGVGIPATAGTLVAARLIQSGLRSRALYNAISKLPSEQQGPVTTAVNALLATGSAQNINRLNTPAPSANNISGNP